MSNRLEWRRMIVAGMIAGAIASCSSAGMDMIGDAMVDAGEAMADAGVALQDAADGMTPDATAQTTCGTSCSAGGTARVMTADTDPAQLLTGTVTESGQLVEGPFVLTDLRGIDVDGIVTTWEISICGADPIADMSTDRSSYSSKTTGARIYVAPGEALCAYRSYTSPRGVLRWAGFRPYD